MEAWLCDQLLVHIGKRVYALCPPRANGDDACLQRTEKHAAWAKRLVPAQHAVNHQQEEHQVPLRYSEISDDKRTLDFLRTLIIEVMVFRTS